MKKEKVAIYIKDCKSGQIRSLIDSFDDYSDLHAWSEGNFSCDCNRADVFADCGGDERPDEDEISCTGRRFLIRIESWSNQEIIYSEFS